MDYTIEDYNYIKDLLNTCIKIKIFNEEWYITSDNIKRLIKYKTILKDNKKTKLNFSKISFTDNLILRIDTQHKYFITDYKKIFFHLKLKHKIHWKNINEYTNKILCDLYQVNNVEYETTSFNTIGFGLFKEYPVFNKPLPYEYTNIK